MAKVVRLKSKAQESAPSSITSLAKGHLFRAIVTLPDELGRRGGSLGYGRGREFDELERVVFFEIPYGHELHSTPWEYLEKLLLAVWGIDYAPLRGDAFICNVTSYGQQIHDAYGQESTGELRFLEIGCGSDFGVGPENIHYLRPKDGVDLFVTPAVAERLRVLMARIEAFYQSEGKHET